MDSRDTHAGTWRERLRRVASPVQRPREPQIANPPAPLPTLLRPQDLRQYRNLLFAAKMVVEGFYAGKHRSPYHDFSAEFADYRSYVPGDEIRALDWKAVARTDRLYVKLFRKETDMSGYLLVDKSASMGFAGLEGVSKLEYSNYLAASIAYLMLKQGDRPGLAMCDDSLQGYTPPAGTLTHLHGILHRLETSKAKGGTNVSGALRTLFPIAKRRGLVIVLSDLLEEPDALFSVLGMYLHRGFTVVLFHVLTEEELKLPGASTARFTDPEGPDVLSVDADSIRIAYRSELQGWLDTLSGGAKARGIHYHLLSTSSAYHEALRTYLTSRGR
jgi:uncharacterized protein (DUF58 family)